MFSIKLLAKEQSMKLFRILGDGNMNSSLRFLPNNVNISICVLGVTVEMPFNLYSFSIFWFVRNSKRSNQQEITIG